MTLRCRDLPRQPTTTVGTFTPNKPKRPMLQEATPVGFYTPEHFPDQQHPRVQIMTIDE